MIVYFSIVDRYFVSLFLTATFANTAAMSHPRPESLTIIATLTRLEKLVSLAHEYTGIAPFAHMRLESAGRTRDVLLADRGDLRCPEIPILDWRTAPLAEVLMTCEPSEAYELEVDNRTVEGILHERHLLICDHGLLTAAQADTWSASLGASGWREEAPTAQTVLCPHSQPQGLKLDPVWLDPEQKRAQQVPRHRPLLVLGQAGTGKTTVAVARLARIMAEPPRGAKIPKAAVIVPSEGLRRLYQRLIDSAGLRRIEIHVFDRWAHRQASRLLDNIPRKLSVNTPFEAIAFKRHPALARTLERWVKAQGQGQARHVDREYLADIHPQGHKRKCEVDSTSDSTQTNWLDLLDMFGDTNFLDSVVEASNEALGPRQVAAVRRHARQQFSPDAQTANAHVHPDHLVTLDGRGLDDGTPDEDAGTLDAEDPPILLALNYLRTGADRTPLGALRRYDVLVVDEAQELAPLELQLLGRAVAPGGSLTVAGDARQQVDPTAYFESWPKTMRDLGADNPALVELQTSYRCPAPVMALACRLAKEPLAEVASQVDKGSLAVSGFQTPLALALRLSQTLEQLASRHPAASTAIVCRTAETADRLCHELRHTLRPRLVRDGDFDFEAGVSITDVSEIKGLEFDVIVVPDADHDSYPDTPEARRALYVAITRAVHGLWLCWTGAPSPLLQLI